MGWQWRAVLRRVGFGAAALLLSAAAAPADVTFSLGAAQGSVMPLTGINTGPIQLSASYDFTPQLQSIGVKLVRTHDFYGPLDMATLYPDRSKDPAQQSSYNFSNSDSYFAAIVNGGFEPYFRLGDSYNNVTVPSDSQRANWVSAAVEVLRHYRQGKWNGFSSSFRYVEIWNEPDNTQFWPKPNTQQQYFQLYEATAKALRAAFPELKIGGPGLTPAAYKTTQGQAWTRAFLDYVKASGSPFDYFSWHMYSNDPADYANAAAWFRAELDSRGFTNVESHLTEWNTDDHNPPAGLSGVDVRSRGAGAAIATAAWIGQQEQGMQQSLFYRAADPTTTAPQFYGMFLSDGRAKKTGLAALLWSEVAGHTTRLASTVATGSAGAMKLFAAQNGAGQIALLAANPGGSSVSWNFTLPAGGSTAGYRQLLKTVNDSADYLQTSVPGGGDLVLPPYTVQLLTLTPNPLPQTGWWWNPSESGRGYTIERQGNNFFVATYLYETDGRATWYYAYGPASADGSFTAPLTRMSGGQTLTGSYRPPSAGASPGTLSLHFTGATTATLTWPGGTTAIERFPIVAGGVTAAPAAFQPETGWWWNAAEGGRGFALEIQNGQLFLAGYLYDAAGNPIWYVSSGATTGSTTSGVFSAFQSQWQQYGHGQALTGGYRAPVVVNTNVGAVALQFTSTTAAILTLPDGRQIPLVRFRF